MKCVVCNHEISADVGYFIFDAHAICEDCAIKTTVYDLYNKSLLHMYNSPDDVIDAEATVMDAVYDDLHDKPSGYIPDCANAPCDKCDMYYGEINACMMDEVADEGKVTEATPEQVEKFFTSPDPVFVPDANT